MVTVRSPVAIDFETSFGEFWVYGDWDVTGKNSRGGLSVTFGTCRRGAIGVCARG